MERRLHLLRTIGFVLFLVVMTAALPGAVWAATCTSTGTGTWNSSNTILWSCARVPLATDDVVIANGHTVTLGVTQTTANVTIQNGGTLQGGGEFDLTVTNLTIDSGGTLMGANGTDLTVTGNWSNSGTFTHNSTDVTLAASSGTQTVSGSTTFGDLRTANSGTKDFGSSDITIETFFSHGGGTDMLAGTSTFTFRGNIDIGGSLLKRFHHLIIDGTTVTHSSGEMRISGDLTVQDDKTLTFSTTKTARFNGSALQTVTLNGTGIARFDTLFINSGAIVRLPAAADSQTRFSVQTLTNSGALQQVKTAVSGATTFLTLKNQLATTVYQGLDVTPGSGTPNITVSIAGNEDTCNNPNGGSYRNRCFRLESSAAAAGSTVTLYSTTGEDDISNDAFFQYVSGVWTNKAACADGVGVGGSCTATVDLAAGDNYFLIGDSTSGPTPVVLVDFSATTSQEGVAVEWQTAVESDFAGFYVWRSAQMDGHFEKVSPLIVATGGPVTGASYRFVDDSVDTPGSYAYRLQAIDLDNSSEFFAPTALALVIEPGVLTTRLFLPITNR